MLAVGASMPVISNTSMPFSLFDAIYAYLPEMLMAFAPLSKVLALSTIEATLVGLVGSDTSKISTPLSVDEFEAT